MPYLLDTYNIIHAGIALGGAFSGLTVRGLCQWIVASPQRLTATLVLDGRAKPDEPTENEFPDIDFVYSGAGISADQVIGQLVERSGNRKKITVVTNDRAVVLHARTHFSSAMSSESFLRVLLGAQRAQTAAERARLPHQKTGGPSSTGETEHWLKEFGLKSPPPAPASQNLHPHGELSNEEIERLMGGHESDSADGKTA